MNTVFHIELIPIKTIYFSSTIYLTSFYLKDCEIIGNDMNSYEGLCLYIIVHILLLFNKPKSGLFLINQKEYDENIIPSNTTFVLFGGKTQKYYERK